MELVNTGIAGGPSMIGGSVGGVHSPMLIGRVRNRTDDLDVGAAQRQVLRAPGCGRAIKGLLATAQALGLVAIGVTARKACEVTMLAEVPRSDHGREPDRARLLLIAVATDPGALMIEQKRAMAAGAALKGCPDQQGGVDGGGDLTTGCGRRGGARRPRA